MEEIKVGDYIKTVAGYIGKIIRYNDGMYTVQMKDVIIDLYIDDIKNYKENLIDLIEEGDYVNGKEVITDVSNTDMETCNGIKHKCIGVSMSKSNNITWTIIDIEIKSIVTKEQFESIKYEV